MAVINLWNMMRYRAQGAEIVFDMIFENMQDWREVMFKLEIMM
jgi:hypothetical protein